MTHHLSRKWSRRMGRAVAQKVGAFDKVLHGEHAALCGQRGDTRERRSRLFRRAVRYFHASQVRRREAWLVFNQTGCLP